MVLTTEFLGQQLNQQQCSAFADRPYDLQNLISCPLTTFFFEDIAFIIVAKKVIKGTNTHWYNETLVVVFFLLFLFYFIIMEKHINTLQVLRIH